jgi:hypothetical protein
MPDSLIFTIMLPLSLIALIVGGLGVYFAVQNAKKNENELKMAFWSVIALGGLTFGGMCWAYFIIPIIANHLF